MNILYVKYTLAYDSEKLEIIYMYTNGILVHFVW